MGYYRYRGRYKGWRSNGYTPSKYTLLSRLFGDAVYGIKQAFLSLDEEPLKDLLEDYKDIYGSSAKQYARRTFLKWKSGETKLSGQTMERLIELVPPYLSSEQRFDLLRQVLKKNPPSRPYKSIRVNVKDPEEGFSEINLALESLVHEDVLAHVPDKVMEAASWLYDDDITVARSMLAEAERKENDIIQDNTKLLIIFANTFTFNANYLIHEINDSLPNIIIAGGNSGDDFAFEKGLVLLKLSQKDFDAKKECELFVNNFFDLIEIKNKDK